MLLSVPAVLEQLEVVPEPGHLAVDVLFLLVGEEGGRHHTAVDQLLGRENLRGRTKYLLGPRYAP